MVILAVLDSADTAFERVANAAADAFARRPAYIAYHVAVRTDAPNLPPLDVYGVTLRTTDGKALQTNGSGVASLVDDPLPLAPAVDAFAEWAFAFDDAAGHVRLKIAYERPKRFVTPAPAPGDTVLVASVGGYRVDYGAQPGHLHLEPASPAQRAFAAQADHFVYRDVWFDPATYLPKRVTFAAPGESFTLDYAVVREHWLLTDFTFDGALGSRAPASPVQHVEAAYSDYEFPAHVPEL